MKKTWQLIEREMKANHMSARQMAKRLQMDPAQLSRLRSGELRDLSAETLSRIIAGIAHTDQARSEILVAYLTDKLHELSLPPIVIDSATEQIEVTERGTIREEGLVPTDAPALRLRRINPRVEAAVVKLAEEAKHNRRLRTILLTLASYVSK